MYASLQPLLQCQRRRADSEGNENCTSEDDISNSEETENILSYLRDHGSTLLSSTSTDEKNRENRQSSTHLDQVTFDELLDDCTKHVEQTLDSVKPIPLEVNTDEFSSRPTSDMPVGDSALEKEEVNADEFTSTTDCLAGDDTFAEDFSSNEMFSTSSKISGYRRHTQSIHSRPRSANISKRSQRDFKCFLCCNLSTRVTEGHQLSIGDHIRFGRYSPNSKSDRFLRRMLKGKLGFLYYHHAIVTEVCEVDHNLISICVVHFSKLKNEDGKTDIKVIEERLEDLDLKEEFMYKVEYGDIKSSTSDVVSRAKGLKGNKMYSVFTNNCEHMAMWCCTGIKASFQWDKKRDTVEIWSVWFSTLLGKIPHFASVADDIVTATRAQFVKVSTAAIVSTVCLPFVALIVESILLFRLLQELKAQLKQKLICLNCYFKKRTRIVAKLVVGFVTSIALMLPTFKYAFPIIGVSILALIILPLACEKLISKVKSKINPTSIIPKMPVQSLHDVQPGDILTVYEGLSSHDVIVEKVQLRKRNQMPNTVSLDIIHYAYMGLLGTRTVIQETITVNLNEEMLCIYDFPTNRVFSDDTTVTRAKRNLGEQKFNLFTNRSSHFAWKCKVLPNVKVGDVEKRLVTAVNDVKAGDVIQFKYCSLPHVAVVSKAEQYSPLDIVGVDFIHVDKDGVVKRDVRDFDLDESYVFVQKYDEGIVDDANVVLEKARQRLGENYESSWVYKSSRFAVDCKRKKQTK